MMPHLGLISYQPKTGEGAYGPVYGDEVVCDRGAIDDKQKLIRGANGDLISVSRVALDFPDHTVPVGSLVTVWRGQPNERTGTVEVAAYADWPRLPKFLELSIS